MGYFKSRRAIGLQVALFGTLALLSPASDAEIIQSVQFDKATYAPGEPVRLSISVKGAPSHVKGPIVVAAKVSHLGSILAQPSDSTVSVPSGSLRAISIPLRLPPTDFQGYAVSVQARDSAGKLLEEVQTALEIASIWTRFPRYGYLSSFKKESKETLESRVSKLREFHLNSIMFYDWQFKHHLPLSGALGSPDPQWKDIAGRANYRQTVLDLLEAIHRNGIAAMNYNLLNGAWAGYGEDHSGVQPAWGLFFNRDSTNQYSFSLPDSWSTKTVFLFNPANPAWQDYLNQRELDVFKTYPFDGWHVDTIGGPPSNVYDSAGSFVDVWKTFTPFLKKAKSALNRPILFNNVGTYGMYDVCANSGTDAIYVECWPGAGQTTYGDLKKVIDQGVEWSSGKGVVLAAYMNYNLAKRFESGGSGSFNEPGVLLTDAAILASGGFHIELGDDLNMLDHEYYPNHNLLPSPKTLENVKAFYNFDVANENLLRSGMKENSFEIAASVAISRDAKPNHVWAFSKNNSDGHVLNFINLVGEAQVAWQDSEGSYPTPQSLQRVVVRYYCGPIQPKEVFWGSPDLGQSELKPLPFQVGSDEKGNYVSFELPSLQYWDLVYVRQ